MESQNILDGKGPTKTIESSSCTEHPHKSHPVPDSIGQVLIELWRA